MATFSMITPRTLFCVVWFFSVTMFAACSDSNDSETRIFKALDEGMSNSNEALDKSTQQLLLSLMDKLSDPLTANKAGIWHPKALMVQELSKGMYMYIESLRMEILQKAGLKRTGGKDVFDEDDKDLVRKFVKKGKVDELYIKLMRYRQDILAIDNAISQYFDNEIRVTTLDLDKTDMEPATFSDYFFKRASPVSALAILSLFQNNIKKIENRLIQFCHNNCYYSYCGFPSYFAIIGQSSSIVKAGETIEITAGVGAFSKAATPKIIIRNKELPINESGVSIYKFKASSRPGNYSLPVKISYIDQDGREQIVEKEVEYSVAEKCAPIGDNR